VFESRHEQHRRHGPFHGRGRGGTVAMPNRGKRYLEASKLIDVNKRYSVEEACAIVGKTAKANYKVPPAKAGKTPKKERKGWDETVDVAIRLGVDPKHADQMVRGAVVLPH